MAVFSAFMKEANRPGSIDARNKKLMAIALSISQRCEPCIKIHMKSALAMGISLEEIDEAASLAVAFGGCTAMMFYKEIRESFAR
jgi:AhpD family alkylhydroperoxidase